jgi:hypothetical protein
VIWITARQAQAAEDKVCTWSKCRELLLVAVLATALLWPIRSLAPQSQLTTMIVYGTAVVDDGGKVHFFDDVYGLDEALGRALDSRKP